MASLILFKNFSVDSLVLPATPDPSVSPSGSKSVEFGEFLIQLPKSAVAFGGLNRYKETNNYSIAINLSGDVLKTFQDLDDKIVQYISDNSNKLLGEQTSVAEVKKFCYNPMVTCGKGDYSSSRTLKLKIPVDKSNQFVAKAFDIDRTKIPMDTIKGRCNVQAIIQFDRIYLMDKKCGVSVRLKQVMKFPSVDMDECAVIEDDEDDCVEEA
jgi:hypothetical protein